MKSVILSILLLSININSKQYFITSGYSDNSSYSNSPNPFEYASAPPYEEVFGQKDFGEAVFENQKNSNFKSYFSTANNLFSKASNLLKKYPRTSAVAGVFAGAFGLRYFYNYKKAKAEYTKSLGNEKRSYLKSLLSNTWLLTKAGVKTSYETIDSSLRIYIYLNLCYRIAKLKKELNKPCHTANDALRKLKKLKKLQKAANKVLTNAAILR